MPTPTWTIESNDSVSVTVNVSLEDVTCAVSDIDLRAVVGSEQPKLCLSTAAAAWDLAIPLPWAVDGESVTAKLQRKKKRLVVRCARQPGAPLWSDTTHAQGAAAGPAEAWSASEKDGPSAEPEPPKAAEEPAMGEEGRGRGGEREPAQPAPAAPPRAAGAQGGALGGLLGDEAAALADLSRKGAMLARIHTPGGLEPAAPLPADSECVLGPASAPPPADPRSDLERFLEEKEVAEGAAHIKEVLEASEAQRVRGRLELRSIEDLDYWGKWNAVLRAHQHRLQVAGRAVVVCEDLEERWGGAEHSNLLWPSALVMAKYLEQRFGPQVANGTRVLEVGAGVGLPGLAMWALGAAVTLTEQRPLDLLEANVAANLQAGMTSGGEEGEQGVRGGAEGGRLCARELDWTWMRHQEEEAGPWRGKARLHSAFGTQPYDIIIGCDVMHRDDLVDDLAATCHALSGPNTVVLMALNQVHNDLERFRQLAARHFRVEVVPAHELPAECMAPGESERAFQTWPGTAQWRWRHPKVVLLKLIRRDVVREKTEAQPQWEAPAQPAGRKAARPSSAPPERRVDMRMASHELFCGCGKIGCGNVGCGGMNYRVIGAS